MHRVGIPSKLAPFLVVELVVLEPPRDVVVPSVQQQLA